MQARCQRFCAAVLLLSLLNLVHSGCRSSCAQIVHVMYSNIASHSGEHSRL